MNWENKRAVSIAGGKGGIGKSSFATNLGVTLARQGRKVVLVDADIGAANLHTLVGVPFPRKTLADFINSSAMPLESAISPTPFENLRLLSSASDILSISSPNYKNNQKLFRAIRALDTDVLVFDIAAGTNHRAIDFFALALIGIVIVEPLPTSMENAFLFIKNLLFRYLLRMFYADVETRDFIKRFVDPRYMKKNVQFNDLLDELDKRAPEKISVFRGRFSHNYYKMCVVANCIRDVRQARVIENFSKIVKRYLGLTPAILGMLPYESKMDVAISQRIPFVVKYPQSEFAKEIERIIARIPFSFPVAEREATGTM